MALIAELAVTLAAGGTVLVPHGLTSDGSPIAPTLVQPDRSTPIGCTAVDALNCSFHNYDTAPATALFLVERIHSIQAQTPLAPFLWAGGTAGVPVVGDSNVARLDAVNGNDATAAVGNGLPFKSMQAAITACKAAHDAIYGTLPPEPPTVVLQPPPSNARQGYVIDVAPYTAYDEDVVINVAGAFHLMITGEAGWDLGLFDGTATNWQPKGAPSAFTGPGVSSRSIRITGNPQNNLVAPNADIRGSVVITSKARAPWHGTNHLAWWGPRIAGRILVDLPNQAGAPAAYAGNLELVLDAEVHGNGFTNAVDCINTTYAGVALGNNPLLTLELNRCRFRKPANFGTQCTLGQAMNSRFDGLLSVGTYGTINLCRFTAGLTATGLAAFLPAGIFSSFLAGTFTGNAGQKLRLDLASNTSLVENGNAVVGWTKTLLNDATI